jgi:hypothetical protein
MGIEQQALLTTVDRVLREYGDNPETIPPQDKVSLATQYVQLYAMQIHVMEDASRRLARALGIRADTPLEQLVVNVECAMKEWRMRD